MGGSHHPRDSGGNPKPAGNAGDRRSVYIPGDLHIFTNKCDACGKAFSVNVKDLTTGGHTTTIACPYCGIQTKFHTD